MLRPYPGWHGMFTRNQAPGAYRNGTRVVKIATDVGDTHPLGATATVLGSLYHPKVGFGYFVEWDSHRRSAVFVVPWKIRPAS